MTCEKFRNLISLYLDHLLAEDELQEFEQHLETCEECRTYYEEINYANELFGSDKEEEVPEALIERIKKTIRQL